VPEGDTLRRTADVLRLVLEGREVLAARGRPGGPPLVRLVGQRIVRVEARGKHLLIETSGDLTLHTHLGMHAAWHRYRRAEAWRRNPDRAAAVIEVDDAVAVCFDAPTVELMDTRAVAVHPVLRELGPDLSDPAADLEAAVRRLREPARAGAAIGDALLDQRAQAGLGNVYRSEVCFLGGVDPFAPVGALPDETLRRLLRLGHELLVANRLLAGRATTPTDLGSPPGSPGPRRGGPRLWVYGRAGRGCLRCGSPVRSRAAGALARRVYWCPSCQPRQVDPAGG